MNRSVLPEAPYTVEQCEQALRAAQVLAVGGGAVAIKQFWGRIEQSWERRLEEAKQREVA